MTGGVEIERKFLLSSLPPAAAGSPGVPIEQGYLAVDGDVEVRVRRLGDRFVLTVKGGSGLVRREEELEIDERRFRALWALSNGRRVEKRRIHVALPGGVLAEIDEYHGALEGLLTAEIEFPSTEAAAAFDPPGWLGPEVTGDPRYANRVLARDGAPVNDW